MSGTEAPTLNRKQRRTKPTQSAKDRQLAQLCMKVYDDGTLVRREGEPDAEYFKRVRDKALQILRHQKRVERRTKRDARKRNRRITR